MLCVKGEREGKKEWGWGLRKSSLVRWSKSSGRPSGLWIKLKEAAPSPEIPSRSIEVLEFPQPNTFQKPEALG